MLAAQFAVENKQLDDQSNIALRQTRGRQFRNENVTAGHLKDPAKLNQLVQTNDAYRLLRQVRGTPAYWQKVHYDVLAMVRQLGIPTWFLTLSAADMKWPDVIQIIARQYGVILSKDDVINMPWIKKSEWLRSNPVTAAWHFQYRLELFWKEVIMSKAIGDITDFMIRIEFQARGSPHAHTLLWVKDAPVFGNDPDEDVVAFIDKYQTCALPLDPQLQELVKLQTHVHSSSCLRYGTCRFGIPKSPSPCTLIASEPEDNGERNEKKINAKSVFKKVGKTIASLDTYDISLEDILHKSEISKETYLNALKISQTGNTLVLKRNPNEMHINSYNPDILRIWQANMDIQFILDAYACVMYVTSYMMNHNGQWEIFLNRYQKNVNLKAFDIS